MVEEDHLTAAAPAPSNDDIIPLLQDDRLTELVRRYLAEGEDGGVRDRYGSYVSQLSSRRFVVPIVGVQGSGKSTALNAIAFDQRILPVDVDETTCVPVEIAWSPTPDSRALIRYANGREEMMEAAEDALHSVVHNGANPGNAKDVERVVLRSSNPLFSDGLVLVDLPGTGSLTAANMATTEQYLSEAVGVIFMLRTVPPLTRSESVFVALQWARLRSAYFLQNRWSDETDDEAQAGRQHNVTVLRDLARRSRIHLDADPRVHVVDADAALRARFSGDDDELEACGLSAFVANLRMETRDWEHRVRGSILAAIGNDCKAVEIAIGTRLEGLRADNATRRKMMEDESRRFDKYIERIDAKYKQIVQNSRTFRADLSKDLQEWAKRSRSELRNTMRTKLRAGIVDGPRLERALRDEQSLAAEDAFEMVELAVLRLKDDRANYLNDMGAWNGEIPEERFSVHREEATKWENLAPPALGAMGTLGGMWAGAKIGALLGTGLGPAGTLVGGMIGGMLGGIASLWLGQQSRELILEQRAKAVESDVFAAIDKFAEQTRKSMTDLISRYCDDVEDTLSTWRRTQVETFEDQRQRMKEMDTLSQTEKEQRIAALLADLEIAGSYTDRIREMSAHA